MDLSGREWPVTVECFRAMTCHVVPVCKTLLYPRMPQHLQRGRSGIRNIGEVASDEKTRKVIWPSGGTRRICRIPNGHLHPSAISARGGSDVVHYGCATVQGEAARRREDWMDWTRLVMFRRGLEGGWPRHQEGTWTGDAVMFVSVCQWFGASEGEPGTHGQFFFACIPHLSEA